MINCYKYHCREDLLPIFSEDEEKNSKESSKDKVKSRSNHPSISVTAVSAGSSSMANIPTITADTATSTLAGNQGVNVCFSLNLTRFERLYRGSSLYFFLIQFVKACPCMSKMQDIELFFTLILGTFS